jgi:hypothetical protein
MEHSEQQPAQQTLAQQPRLLETTRRVKASQGVEWISQAWKIYRRNKIKWPAIFLTFFLISLLTQWLVQGLMLLNPYAGIPRSQQDNIGFSIFFFLTTPLLSFLGAWINMLFSGGIMYACNRSATYGELKFKHLFAAFASKKKAFFIFLLFYLAAVVVAAILFATVFTAGMITTPEPNPATSPLMLSTFVVLIIFFVLLLMSIWFAPCLIMLHDIKPWAAMKMSFTACLRNIPAGIVNILMWIVIYIGLIVGICIIAGIAIGVFALLFGETVPSFAGTGIVAFGIIAYIVLILSALVLAVLASINIYTAYRNLLTDAPLEN